MKKAKTTVSRESASKCKKSQRHIFSNLLENDPRVGVAPRHVAVVHEGQDLVYMVKIYASFETPGSELMTVSRVGKDAQTEIEMRYDEKYPISFGFKKQSDEERVKIAKDQIERTGGFQPLGEAFSTIERAKTPHTAS